MKKTLSIFFFLIFFIGDSYAENFKMGQKIENEFKFSKKVSFPLEPGVWEVINREVWFFGAVKVRLIGLILVENNEVVAFREFQEGKLSGGYQADLNISIHEYLYKDKYDGCYNRPEYTFLKKINIGNSHNCLIVRHYDLSKELYSPDDPDAYTYRKNYRFYLENNNLKIPNNLFYSYHAYFSRLVNNNLYTAVYLDIPERLGAPKNKFESEDTSEYHPSNINKYPKFKKFMDKFVKISSQRHINFENNINAKNKHKLKFTNISTNKTNDSKILDQLNKLNTLYKDGVLTKEEFEKAKKKILN